MWGGVEAYELQVLLLLEILHVHAGGLDLDVLSIALRYVDFLRPRHPELGPRPLSASGYTHEAIAAELRAFRADLGKETPS